MTSLYHASIVPMQLHLDSIKGILKKGEEFCKRCKVDQKVMLSSRLHCTMLPLTFQVQMCSNMAKLLASRVAGWKGEAFPDDEETFDDLYDRLDKTADILRSIKPEAMIVECKPDVKVETPLTSFTLNASDYVLLYAMPNFYFHMTTMYAILRSQGVPLSKLDVASFKTSGSKLE